MAVDPNTQGIISIISAPSPPVPSGPQPDSGIQTAITSPESNLEIAYQQLVAEGFTSVAAEGIVGNLEEESGVNPENKAGDGGVAWGIAQWHPGRRDASLFTGDPSKDLLSQLQHIQAEYQGAPDYYQLGALQAATTPEQAADIVDQYYERSSGAARQQREQYASQIATDVASQNWPTVQSQLGLQALAGPTGTIGDPNDTSGFGAPAGGKGFLSALNSSLNPSYGLDPFKDVQHAIGTSVTRGGLALIGIMIVGAGVLIIGLSVILPLIEKGVATAGPGGRVANVIRLFPDADDRRAKRAKRNPGPTRKDKPKDKSVTQKELAQQSVDKGTSPGQITTNDKGERVNSAGEVMF